MTRPPNVPAASLRTALARASRYRGLLVVALWQVPVGPVTRTDGSIAFLFGAGYDEFATVSCEGQVLETNRVAFRALGAEADYNLDERLRVTATAGQLDSDLDSYGGAFAGGQARLDFKYLGIGAGVFSLPNMQLTSFTDHRETVPSLHLRIGSAQAAHFRTDVFPPNVLGAHQLFRIGLGFNATDRDRPSGFVGVAAIGRDEGRGGIALDFDLPATRHFGFTLRAHAADGHGDSLLGASAGGRIRFD